MFRFRTKGGRGWRPRRRWRGRDPCSQGQRAGGPCSDGSCVSCDSSTWQTPFLEGPIPFEYAFKKNAGSLVLKGAGRFERPTYRVSRLSHLRSLPLARQQEESTMVPPLGPSCSTRLSYAPALYRSLGAIFPKSTCKPNKGSCRRCCLPRHTYRVPSQVGRRGNQ